MRAFSTVPVETGLLKEGQIHGRTRKVRKRQYTVPVSGALGLLHCEAERLNY